MRRRWLLVVIGGTALGLAAAVVLVLHLPSVQRGLFEWVVAEVAATTGLEVTADRVSARLWPARLVVDGLRVEGRTAELVSLERLEARWRWRRLLGTPARVDWVGVAGLRLDLDQLPELPESLGEEPAEPTDPWRLVEIGRLELRRGAASRVQPDLAWRLDGLDLSGCLTPEGAVVEATAASLAVARAGRTLALGPLRLAASADPSSGLRLDRLAVEGSAIALEVRGSAAPGEPPTAEVSGRLNLEPAALIAWWDPALMSGLALEGSLDLEIVGELRGLEAVRFSAVHQGDPLRVLGLEIEQLAISGGLEEIRAELAGAGWGAVTGTWRAGGGVAATMLLEGARPAAVVDALGLPWPDRLGRGLRVDGQVELASPLPPQLATASGSLDLRAAVDGASLEVAATAAGGAFEVARLEVALGEATLAASGGGRLDGAVDGRAELDAPDLAALVALLGDWLPAGVVGLELGGEVTAEATVGGTFEAPDLQAEALWNRPLAAGLSAQRWEASATGGRARLDWRSELVVRDGLEARVTGSTALSDLATGGSWSVAIADLARLGELGLPVELPALSGAIDGVGGFTWGSGSWSADGRLEASELGWQGWRVPSATVELEATPAAVVLRDLSAELAGGRIAGTGELPIAELDGPLRLELAWLGIDLARLPVEVPAAALGTIAGRLELAGTAADPVGEAEVEWLAADPTAQLVDRCRLLAVLDAGVVRAATDGLATDVGEVDIRVTAPLGDLPRPSWLLRGAPGGPMRVSGRIDGASSKQLLAALGRSPAPIEATGDLRLELEWQPPDLGGLVGELRLEGLRATSAYETFTADGPLVVELRPGMLTVPSVVLATPDSRLEVAGRYDLLTHEIEGVVDASLSADAARLLPLPAGARGALELILEVRGQASAPSGRLVLDHRGGTIVLRDQALEISDLYLEAEFDRGVVTIQRGSAGVNRGRLEIGGGWDPESGQGVVAELENVVLLLPGGILTAWSGNLAIEPDPGRLARVTGELVLESGLWDSPFSLTSSFLGGSGLDVGTEEILYDIGLDLQVRGRRGVRVDNNLGDLEVSWSTLQVTGTAAEPVVRGDLKIAPGGKITVAGQVVTVRRGTIRMTGDPTTDPQIEIVPEQDLASYEAGAAGDGEKFDTEMIATRGLAKGVGSALGFENESLEPAEIAVDTEVSSATSFSLGQRLTSNIALMLTTDLAESANRTTMIQLWNLNRLPGLAFQVYESTEDEGSGANVIQRFRWGGTAPDEDRPEIHRIKLEGDWPISKRRARKATGLQRGQPYDPFLVFAARVRLERELAGAGYPLARVDGRAEGSERAPTLVFSCETGPLTEVRFEGDVPPRRVRREVTALYQPPPLEGPALALMRDALLRHAWGKGHAAAEVVVDRRGEAVVARVTLGAEAEFTGPFLHGVPPEAEPAVRALLASPVELAAALEQPARLERGLQRILRSRGWEHSRLASVTGARGAKGEVEVHVEVIPGPRERVAAVERTGSDPLGLLAPERVGLRVGDPLDRSALEQELSSVRFAYVEAGYTDVQLHSRVLPAGDDGWSVELQLEPGQQRRVAETRVVGLRHLSEKVVRHGITLEPGDVLKPSEVDRSVVEIGTFAPVERVDVRVIPASPGLDIVELEVTEKPRWTVEAGVGWSTERGSELRIGLRDDNLFHRGFGLNLRGRWQSDEQLALLIATLPPLPGSRWRFGSTLRYFDGPDPSDPDNFDQTQYTASLEATFERSASDAIRAYYQIRQTESTFVCKDPDDPFCFVSTVEVIESIVGASFLRDRMDNLFDPRGGYTLSLDLSTNRPQVGSDLSDVRALMSAGLAVEPVAGWTWAHRLQLGWAEAYGGAELNSERRFFAGGQGTIRGFDRDTVGPVDLGADFTLTPAGGSALAIVNQELRIPVWGPVRGAVFVDVGQVWESWADADLDLAVGAGLGVRISTPVGPIWADVAWPVANEGALSAPGAKYYVGIGRPF